MTSTHNFLTPDPITIEIRNATGAVTVDLADTTMTTVELVSAGENAGFLDDVVRAAMGGREHQSFDEAADEVAVSFTDNRLAVDTEPARRHWHAGFVVRITAPAGSGVRTRSETAAVAVTGRPDRLEVKTASGDVSIDATVSNTLLRTVSGDIEVRDASAGELDLAAVSGSLSVGVHPGVAAKVDLVTVAGRARSDLPVKDRIEGSSLVIKGRTVSGNIRLVSAS
jgi:Putative adhesin